MSAQRRLKGPLEPKQLRCRRQLHNWVYILGASFGPLLGLFWASWGPWGLLGGLLGSLGGLMCKPICEVAWCSATVWLEGPLEPPFGRTFTPDCTLQRACIQPNIHHSEYPIFESLSFLERVCCSTSSGQERLRGLSVLEKEQIIIFITRTYLQKTQYAI